MDISQRPFNCDETPTPTRFIRNCEEVGLFQDLQTNPFEETFRIAVQTKHTSTLPEPLSKSANADPLDTPQVVPNSKRIEDYRTSYPIIEDDDDEIKLPNNDYLMARLMEADEDSLSNDVEIPPENSPLLRNIESNESQINVQVTTQINEPEKNVIDLTESPVVEQTYNFKPQSASTEIIEEILFERQEIMTNASITEEFLILHGKNNVKENTFTSTVVTNENVVIVPPKNDTVTDSSFVKIIPKIIQPTESSVKQRLKKLLKPSENSVPEPIPIIIENNSIAPMQPSGGETSDDKLSYSRERNRMAQKRCRLKKKKWISQLKQDTESVHNENKQLRSEVVSLKAEVAHLKTLLLAHKSCPVTLAMQQANSSNVAQKEAPIPQISTLSTNVAATPIPYAIISATGTKTQNFQKVKSKTNQNKTIILNPTKVPIPQLNSVYGAKPAPKSYTTERNQSLKVIISKNPNIDNSKSIVNSPNAVNVICYNQNQNITDITDLTFDTS